MNALHWSFLAGENSDGRRHFILRLAASSFRCSQARIHKLKSREIQKINGSTTV